VPVFEVDAVVIGGGHHGLVAAAVLADAGWDVLVLEAQPDLGGAVRSTERYPGFVADRFSAFYPLAAVSPALRSLELERHGLRWAHAPSVLAHPLRPDGDAAAVLHRDPERTAAALDAQHPGDGAAWLALCAQWRAVEEPLLRSLFTTFPPVLGPVELLRRIGTADALRLLRFLLLPVARMGEERFGGAGARLLLAGNAAHTDVPITAPGSGIFGLLLAMVGQHHGFPTPTGGAGELTTALARRAEAAGAVLRTGEPVERILVEGGRAVGVESATGLRVRVRRAVVADVSAPDLYLRLLPPDAVPARVRGDLSRFLWDSPTLKVDWALDGPIPWRAPDVAGAGTVHLGADIDGLVRWESDLTTGSLPSSPYLVLGQMTTADPSRSPAGTESVWAYTHVPRGCARDAVDELARRVDAVVEAHAPGFRDRILDRAVQRPADLAAADANLGDGAVGGGTSHLFQQLVFRPVPGLGRPETPIERLYLGSAAAHPGGGVHGVCGFLAAKAALAGHGRAGLLRRRVTSAALALVHGD
jgi:phytoene dehydrogenase-like protein